DIASRFKATIKYAKTLVDLYYSIGSLVLIKIDEELLQEVVNIGFDRNQLVESLCNRIQNELAEPTEQDLRQMKNQKSPKYDLP
ncbi:hypothetical protein S83_035713, partial [Arachis hypogaea]